MVRVDDFQLALDRLVGYFNNFTKIGAQRHLGRTPAVTLDQAAQGQDRLAAVFCPGHPRMFHTLGDQGFAAGFHLASGNE